MEKNGLAALGLGLAVGASMGANAADEISIEVVQNPKIVRWATVNLYPFHEIQGEREGWVVLTLMVDAAGMPHDVMVSDSSGNPAFERAAVRGIDKMTFEPGRLNGTPVDASFMFKMIFSIDHPAKSANPQFVTAYRKLMKAVEARDKPKADEQFARLDPINLYEEAFANLAKYYYHAAWGTPEQQREDLAAAIANERKPVYLPKDLFVTALFKKFKLDVAASDLGEALDTWEMLEPLASPDMRQNVQRVVDEIHAIQAGNQLTRISGRVNDRGRWSTSLLRNRFNVAVKEGSISDVNLACTRKNLSFKFQADMQYSIGSPKERCQVVLIGQAGTSFEFNQ
ncbi:MAG TPA: TonB family protein [Steroidobacteraceae bacterium]